MHFEVRKRVQRKLTNFNQYNMKLLYIVMYQQEDNLVHSWLWKFLVNNHLFKLEWDQGHSFKNKKTHEEHNDTYCDLPNTFLFGNFFAFDSHL